MLIYNGFLLTKIAVIGCSNLHFFFNRTNAIKVFNVEYDIKNYRMIFFACRQSSANLLFVNNWRYRRAQQNNTANIIKMDTLVKRIYAIK